MRNPFKRRTPRKPPEVLGPDFNTMFAERHRAAMEALRDPDTDPIYVTSERDPSLADDEMIIHTTIEPTEDKQ